MSVKSRQESRTVTPQRLSDFKEAERACKYAYNTGLVIGSSVTAFVAFLVWAIVYT